MPQRRDLRASLVSDLEQIEDNASFFRSGRNSAYQTVAIQLRNLLLGGRKGLVSRVIPDPAYHPLTPSSRPRETIERLRHRDDDDEVVFDSRGGGLQLTTRGLPQLSLAFDESASPVPVEAWLRDWVIDPRITIKDLIERVANEEVAHTQDIIDKVLLRASAFSVAGSAAGGRVLHQMAVVSIGEYVARRTRSLLADLDATTSARLPQD